LSGKHANKTSVDRLYRRVDVTREKLLQSARGPHQVMDAFLVLGEPDIVCVRCEVQLQQPLCRVGMPEVADHNLQTRQSSSRLARQGDAP